MSEPEAADHGDPPRDEYWERFQRIWDAILPPLRPAPGTVEAFLAEAPPERKWLLLLGVTPELAHLG